MPRSKEGNHLTPAEQRRRLQRFLRWARERFSEHHTLTEEQIAILGPAVAEFQDAMLPVMTDTPVPLDLVMDRPNLPIGDAEMEELEVAVGSVRGTDGSNLGVITSVIRRPPGGAGWG